MGSENEKKVVDSATPTDTPIDKRSMVYIVFTMLGIGTLLPWNMFISVNNYWSFKFRSVNATFDAWIDDAERAEEAISGNQTYVPTVSDMQMEWGPQVTVASMVPNVTLLILNAVFGHRFRTQPRLLVSLIMVILLFAITSAMTMVDSDDWQNTFLIITLISVVLININAAIFQGGLLGVAGRFPPRYMGGVFSGQAVGGILASVTNVIMLSLGAGPQYAAFFCFLFAVAFLAFGLVLYTWLTKSEFFHFYLGENQPEMIGAKEVEKVEEEKLMDGPHPPPVKVVIPTKVNPLLVSKQISLYAFSVFFCFVVTLACFPATTAQAVSVNQEYFTWANTYYIPVCCFVLFNVGDYIGRILAGKIQWPKPGKAGMVIAFFMSISRVAFVPLFLFCHVAPNNRANTPILFHSDTAYIIIMLLFSVSNGYLSSICMISAPQICRKEEQQTAASLMVALLGLGLGCGALLSAVVVMGL